MIEDFTLEKLKTLAYDFQNIDHNSLFIQLFPSEIVDDFWLNETFKISEDAKELLIQILLITYACDESIPGKIRNRELHFENVFYSSEGKFDFYDEFNYLQEGIIVQIIDILQIKTLIFRDIDFIYNFTSQHNGVFSPSIKSISLVNIKIEFYQVRSLPDEFISNNSIEELKFFDVSESLLPNDLTKMTGLKRIEYVSCHIEKLPLFNSYNKIEILSIEKSRIEVIDILNLNLINLKEINFILGDIKEVINLESAPHLRKIKIFKHKLKNIDIENLLFLEELNVGKNLMNQFPVFNKNTQFIKKIDLSYNPIDLPSELPEFQNLEDLNLEKCIIETVDERFYSFKNVVRLNLRQNQIKKISIPFNEFKRLASINLEYNYLDSIVNSLNEISNKNTEIRLLGNELSNNEKNNIINTDLKYLTL